MLWTNSFVAGGIYLVTGASACGTWVLHLHGVGDCCSSCTIDSRCQFRTHAENDTSSHLIYFGSPHFLVASIAEILGWFNMRETLRSSRSSKGTRQGLQRKQMLFQLSTAEILYDRHLSPQENRRKRYKFMLLLFVLSPLHGRTFPGHIIIYMSITNSGLYLENNWRRPVPIHTISLRFKDGQVARYETPKSCSSFCWLQLHDWEPVIHHSFGTITPDYIRNVLKGRWRRW